MNNSQLYSPKQNIRNGNELKRIIFNKVPLKNCINDLNEFIDNCKNGKTAYGTYLCSSKILASSRFKMNKHQPDLLIFTIGQYNSCHIIELKDGDDFDTKKSQSEKNTLIAIKKHLYPMISDIFRVIACKICCFNQKDKNKIMYGLKKKFTISEIITGQELCNLLGIQYSGIINERNQDANDNFYYVIEEVCKITEVKTKVNELQRQIVLQNDFYE